MPIDTPSNTPTDEKIQKQLKALKIKQEQDAIRLQILIGKLDRTAGNSTPAPILMGALCHMVAMLIAKRFAPEKHTSLMTSFVRGVEAALHSTYPPELIAQVRAQRADALANTLADQMEHALKMGTYVVGGMTEDTTTSHTTGDVGKADD